MQNILELIIICAMSFTMARTTMTTYQSLVTPDTPVCTVTSETPGDCNEQLTEDVLNCIEKYAEKYNVCPEYVMAVAEGSSKFGDMSPNQEYIGPMGLNGLTDKRYIEDLVITDLESVDNNVHTGVYKISELFRLYDDPYLVAMMYEPGDKASAQMEWEHGEFSDFAVSVVERSVELERLNGK